MRGTVKEGEAGELVKVPNSYRREKKRGGQKKTPKGPHRRGGMDKRKPGEDRGGSGKKVRSCFFVGGARKKTGREGGCTLRRRELVPEWRQ